MLGLFFSFLSSVTWSIGSIHYSALAKTYSAYSVNFTRAMFALPLFVIATFAFAGGWEAGLAEYSKLDQSHWGWFLLSMVCSYGLGDLCFFVSTRSLGVPGALAIASAYPVWTLAASATFLKDSVSALQAGGVLLVVTGVIAVILQTPKPKAMGSEGTEELLAAHSGSSRRANRADTSVVLGFLLAAMTSVFWAINAYAVSEGGQGILSTVGNSVRMVLALGITYGMRCVLDRRGPWRVPVKVMKAKAWVFVMEAFGGSLFFLYGLSHSPLFMGTTLSSLAPVLSVPIAVATGVERFHMGRFLAILLVLAGVFAVIYPV